MSIEPCEFTLKHYRQILERAKDSSYEFLRLMDVGRLAPGKRQIVLRHDIDFSAEDAMRMAALEREVGGLFSTYCVLLHAPTYHVGEVETYRFLKEIMKMGHEIALHYDLSFFEGAGISPLEGIGREALFLGELLGTKIVSVAQHKPGTYGRFAGVGNRFIDAYSPMLIEDIRYLSDSRRTWRSGCVCEHLKSAPAMQVLIHPEWWEARDGRSRRGTIERLVKTRQNCLATFMEEYAMSMENGNKTTSS